MAAIAASLGRIGRAVGLAAALAAAAVPAWARGALIRDAEIEHTIARMSDPIFRAAGLSPQAVRIFLLQDPRLNAFVTGGGVMVLNTGLLQRFPTHEPLAGVIAHEAGHIAGGHHARRSILAGRLGPAQIGLLVAAAAAAAAGGAPEVGAAVALGGTSALQRAFLAYSRAEESSADQAAVSYLERVGINPAGMLEVLNLFRGQEVFRRDRLDPYAQTHPLSSERLSLLERRISQSGAARTPPDPDMLYWHQRMRAKLDGFLERPERVLARLDTDAEPESEPNLYRRAIAEHRLGRTDAALATLERLRARRPNDPYYLDLKGQILFEAGRPDQAVAALREATRLAPDEALIRGALGRALLASGAPGSDREALEVLERAIRDDPGEPGVLRDLAVAYARDGQDGLAALTTAERLALSGDFAEAKVLARRATGLLPEGSPAWLRADDILALDERDR